MTMGKKEFWLKRLFRSNMFFVLVLLLLSLFSVSLFREIMRKLEIKNEVKKLETEVAELENRNTELQTMIQYFQTDEFIEKEGRAKLGYKRPGETVVAVATASQINPATSTAPGSGERTNLQLWFDYFFK